MRRTQKYKSIRCQAKDGTSFPSKLECKRYEELLLLQRAGAITRLEIQPPFVMNVNGVKICTYFADFAYFEQNARVVEDAKSTATKTPVYRLKRKLLLALYPGIDHREITK